MFAVPAVPAAVVTAKAGPFVAGSTTARGNDLLRRQSCFPANRSGHADREPAFRQATDDACASALGDPRGVGLIGAAGRSSAGCLGRSALCIACEVAEPRKGRCGKNSDYGNHNRKFDDRKAVISSIDLVPHPDFSLPLSATREPSSLRRITRFIELRSSISESL